MRRQITGFHLDDKNDWVAELSCEHYQHVRHNPPWTNREWVVTANGRAEKLGEWLNCIKCDTNAPPDNTSV